MRECSVGWWQRISPLIHRANQRNGPGSFWRKPNSGIPTAASYFNLTHPDKALRILDRDESEANLNWNVAVGMVRPDDSLRDAIDGALERLRADGTIERIYRRYGVILQSPK